MNDVAPRDEVPRDEDRPPRRFGSRCEDCAHVRAIRSGKGSVFLLCRQGVDDPSWPKYPPQPVIRCPRFEAYVRPM